MKLLCLDTAPRNVGWAVGETTARPAFSAMRFPPCGDRFGWLAAQYQDWLTAMIKRHNPDLIVTEKPVMFTSSRMRPIDHYKTLSMTGITELTCERLRVPCDWVDVPTVKKHFAGSGRAKKPDMIFAARQLGYQVSNDNEADALAIFSYGVSLHDEQSAANWLPLSSAS